MNPTFQSWFAHDMAAEALCGLDGYFVPDVTYRDEHDFILAVGELLQWAGKGKLENAARAFETAIAKLLDLGRLRDALLLLRSYFILCEETSTLLPLEDHSVAANFGQAVRNAGQQLAQEESLRTLLLIVSNDFPLLRVAIGLKETL